MKPVDKPILVPIFQHFYVSYGPHKQILAGSKPSNEWVQTLKWYVPLTTLHFSKMHSFMPAALRIYKNKENWGTSQDRLTKHYPFSLCPTDLLAFGQLAYVLVRNQFI